MINITSNIDQVIARFKLIKERSQTVDFSEALLFGVNAAKGSMQNRIFDQGRDAAENPLGRYRGEKSQVDRSGLSNFLVGSSPNIRLSRYEEKRVKAGRQVRYKDLEFEGTLRRGIVVIKETPTRVVCSIPNDDLIFIARAQEKDLKTDIFKLSNHERELMRDQIIQAIKQLYAGFFNS